MNIDTIVGEGATAKGQIKESLGAATGDQLLENQGITDQIAGNLRKAFGAARDFVRNQPLAAAAIAGILGASLFTGMRRR